MWFLIGEVSFSLVFRIGCVITSWHSFGFAYNFFFIQALNNNELKVIDEECRCICLYNCRSHSTTGRISHNEVQVLSCFSKSLKFIVKTIPD